MVPSKVRLTPAPIQKHDFGVHHHRTAELQKLLLAARQVTRQFISDLWDLQEFDDLIRLRADTLFFRTNLGGANPCIERFSPLAGTIIRFSRTVSDENSCAI